VEDPLGAFGGHALPREGENDTAVEKWMGCQGGFCGVACGLRMDLGEVPHPLNGMPGGELRVGGPPKGAKGTGLARLLFVVTRKVLKRRDVTGPLRRRRAKVQKLGENFALKWGKRLTLGKASVLK